MMQEESFQVTKELVAAQGMVNKAVQENEEKLNTPIIT
jgi:hypothetical protein